MKNKFQSLMTVALLGLVVALSPVARANDLSFAGKGSTNAVSAGGGTLNSNLAYYIVPGNSSKAGGPAVEYLNVTSDAATGKVVFRTETNSATLSAASSGTTNKIYVASGGAAFISDSIIVLRHAASETYERLIVLGSTSTTITLTNATALAVAKGDTIHQMSASGSLPVGNVCLSTPPSKEFAPPSPLFRGEPGEPLLVEVTGAGTNVYSINAISGRYNFEVINGAHLK